MIRSFVFSQKEGRLITKDVTTDLLRVFLCEEGAQFWVDINGVSDEETKFVLEDVFHFHPLSIEDCLTPSDRPKIEEYEDYVFMEIHAVDYAHSAHRFSTTELTMFVGKNFLVTFHRDNLRSIDFAMDRVLKNTAAVAKAPDRLTYTILDSLLEHYGPALEELSGEISSLERDVLTNPAAEIISTVLEMKAEVQSLREIVWPQREVIARLARGEFKIIRKHMLPYYRDLLDQLIRISTMAENYRDSVTSVLQMHLNLQQMQVNRVMKILTLMATLSLPVLAVTSFYGMNFHHWPDFESPFAYAWVCLVTGGITLFLYLFLKRKGWW